MKIGLLTEHFFHNIDFQTNNSTPDGTFLVVSCFHFFNLAVLFAQISFVKSIISRLENC